MKIKVGVIFGGTSVEHEVSIISAVQAMHHMDKEKYEVVPIYITKDKCWYTGKLLQDIELYKDLENLTRYAKRVQLVNDGKVVYLQSTGLFKKCVEELDVVFPIVHGLGVEDGSLQGYLEMLGIPYVGCDLYAASVGQDKIFQKQIFESNNIPIVKYEWFYDYEYIDDKDKVLARIKKLTFPVVVKPARLGSSIGITLVKDKKSIEDAIEEAIKYDSRILVEEAVSDLIEVNCSVLGSYEYCETSVLERVGVSKDILSYTDKYIGGGKGSKGMSSAVREIPAKITKELEKEIREISEKAFKIIGASGVIRIDYLINKKEKKAYLNEVNIIPGDLSFYLWKPAGKSYETLIDDLITLTVKNYKKKLKKTTSFNTNILQNNGGLKGNKLKGKLQ